MLFQALVLAGQVAVAAVSATVAPKPAHRPRVNLDVFPRGFMMVSPDGSATPPSVRVVINDADENLWCPGVEVEWGDGLKSAHEEDCAPYDKADPAEIARWSSDRIEHSYHQSGDFMIIVRLKKGDRRIGPELSGVIRLR